MERRERRVESCSVSSLLLASKAASLASMWETAEESIRDRGRCQQ